MSVQGESSQSITASQLLAVLDAPDISAESAQMLAERAQLHRVITEHPEQLTGMLRRAEVWLAIKTSVREIPSAWTATEGIKYVKHSPYGAFIMSVSGQYNDYNFITQRIVTRRTNSNTQHLNLPESFKAPCAQFEQQQHKSRHSIR